MCNMNNTALVDHIGVFMFVEVGYPWSYHDVTICKIVKRNWKQLFTNHDDYYQYVQGDQGYTSLEKYIMRSLSKVVMRAMNLLDGLVKIFNKMQCKYKVKVKWGIGGLKMKWRRLMKRFNLHKAKFAITFTDVALLTNFIEKRQTCMPPLKDQESVGQRTMVGKENPRLEQSHI